MRASITSLYEFNPWWQDIERIEKDPQVTEWRGAAFRWVPRLCRTFEDADVIYTMRGPRRVGKTTLLKLKIMELLRKGTPPKNILYFSCDLLDGPRQLAETVDLYLDQVRGETPSAGKNERTHIFIDEVSSVKDWQKGLKAIIDAGKLRGCTVILTGSHSMDIRKASETLAGRRGDAASLRYGSPDKVFLPMKFSEYAETRSAEVRGAIREVRALSPEGRKAALLQVLDGKLPELFRGVMGQSRRLEEMLDDYLITGGMPQAINEYASRHAISDGTYSDFVDLIMKDISQWGGEEVLARQVLWRVSETMATQVSPNALKEGTEIADYRTVEKYLNALKGSFVLGTAYRLDVTRGQPFYRKERKVYFVDPFIFHACRGWLSGRDAFDASNMFLETAEMKGRLLEGVVFSHMARLAYGLAPSPLFDASSAVFYWKSRKGRELDFAFSLEGKYVPVEVKYSSRIRREDCYSIYDFMKTGTAARRGIVVTRDVLEVEAGGSCAKVPCYLFLLLA
uniref:ATP-binding protein n=1 Tax=Candidatus Methanomethylicus mesodigestus TaxID=1867258 RepID=A0A7C3J2L8_9CREN